MTLLDIGLQFNIHYLTISMRGFSVMSEQSIERVDEIPIIFHKVKQMGIQERID